MQRASNILGQLNSFQFEKEKKYGVIYVGSGKGLFPIQCQAIIQTNADLLSIRPPVTYFGEILFIVS